MKASITDLIKNIYVNGAKWLKLEVEYARLTIAEKVIVLLSTLVFGAVCMLLGLIILVLLSLALVNFLSAYMPYALSCLCVCGIILVLVILIYLLRRPLFENPISRLISKLILDIKPEKENE